MSIALAVEPSRWAGEGTRWSQRASRKQCEWPTPAHLLTKLQAEFGCFALDPCATPENATAPRFYTKAEDGLLQSWAVDGPVFVNPPYDRTIGAWVRKAYETALAGGLVICLVPARTDVGWWHDYAVKAEVRFIRGRLKFGTAKDPAPFPSVLLVFRPQVVEP